MQENGIFYHPAGRTVNAATVKSPIAFKHFPRLCDPGLSGGARSHRGRPPPTPQGAGLL